MNAKNTTTGVIHTAAISKGFLLQTCGRTNTLVALTETTEAVTCKRCIKAIPAAAPKAETTEIPAAMRKVIKNLAGKGWVSWREVGAGNATVAKMVKMGLLESRASETEFRTI